MAKHHAIRLALAQHAQGFAITVYSGKRVSSAHRYPELLEVFSFLTGFFGEMTNS